MPERNILLPQRWVFYVHLPWTFNETCRGPCPWAGCGPHWCWGDGGVSLLSGNLDSFTKLDTIVTGRP